MPGYIKKRTYKRADGTAYDRWRTIIPDPSKPASASAKIEKTYRTKGEAERALVRLQGAVQQGSFIDPRRGETTLREVAELWRSTWDIKPLAALTQRDYANILAKHVLPRWGDVRVGAIDAGSVQRWIGALSQTHHPETVFHIYGVLRGCLKTAVQHKLIATNPCSRDSVTLPSKKRARANGPDQLYLTAAQLRQLVNALPERWQLPTLIAGIVGLRAGELWALRRCDVDPLHGTLTVRYAIKDVGGELMAGPTKTYERRTIRVDDALRDQLRAQLENPGPRRSRYPAIVNGTDGPELKSVTDAQSPERLLFTTVHGHAVQQNNFYERVYRKAVCQLWPEGHRLHRLRFHDLRHTSASLMLGLTGNLGMVQKRLGHESIETTFNRYGHLLPQDDQSLADALGRLYAGAGEPERGVVELAATEEA